MDWGHLKQIIYNKNLILCERKIEMIVESFLNMLDGCGLVITDMELLQDELKNWGFSLHDYIYIGKTAEDLLDADDDEVW